VTERQLDEPAFILCAARSGSTLLRQVLDTHPEMACPPELNLAAAFDNILFAFRHSYPGNGQDMWDLAKEQCRRLAGETAGEYARHQGKQRWCEKSLSSLEHADLLSQVFPEARFVCLYRNCTDVIASAVEASPWGYGGYGFEKYVQSTPGNVVLALAHYWVDNVTALLSFEETHKSAAYRLRYEDLACAPAETVSSLCEFLKISWENWYIDADRVFAVPSATHPGDYKIRYTRKFETSSVGRGWSVPIELIPQALQDRINEINAELDYPRLDSGNHESPAFKGSLDRSDINVAAGGTASMIFNLIRHRLSSLRDDFPVQEIGPTIRIILADRAEPWIIDLRARSISEGCCGEADCSITTDIATLYDIAARRRSAAVELRHSRVRLAAGKSWSPERFLKLFDVLVYLLIQETGTVLPTDTPGQ
jgi:hypothetical protein